MANRLVELKAVFSEKSQVLERAKQTLKKEFVGIDGIIDEIIENVRSWYVLSEIQEKPTVINLWGLTGTGKTSLVLRLMQLIGYAEHTYRFDLGEKEGNRSFKSALNDLCNNPDDSPIAIILDELQHARTVEGPYRAEIKNDQNRMIWELIDSGNVSYIEWKGSLWTIKKLVVQLEYLLNARVKVKNGKVTQNKDLFIKELDIPEEDRNPLLFIQESKYKFILDLVDGELGLELEKDIKSHLLSLNGEETIQFLKKIINIGTKPSVKSFRSALIFVLGNVDEAYTMSGDYNADISADEFHEISLKITTPDIKKALRKRFRDEQIARLGNIHIIYPAFSKASYIKIIQMDLERITQKIKEHLSISIAFEESVIHEIYKEGVYPTQGARPLFTTIHQMIKSKLSLNINVLFEKELETDRMVFSVADEQLVCTYYKSTTVVHTHRSPITYNLERLRKPKKDEAQVITAVHEAGHAVLSISLLNIIPEVLVSVTSDSSTSGFMYAKNDKSYTSKAELLPRTAMLLGGLVAEELIFGENHITTGSTNDIKKATRLLMKLYKEEGFGEIPAYHARTTEYDEDCYHNIFKIEEEVKSILQEAKAIARQELVKHKDLLLAIAEVLAEEAKIEKAQLEELIDKHSNIKLCNTTNDNYYRKKLEETIKTKQIYLSTLKSNPLMLNKLLE